MFINTELFRTEAAHFVKYLRYNDDPPGSPAWIEYWTEQKRRRKEGYSVGGVKITGDHYHYLNFSQIKRTDDNREERVTKSKKSTTKLVTFPDFWDGDYEYFWIKEIARNGISVEDYNKLNLSVKIKLEHLSGGKNIIVAKARRKGFSFKNGAIAVNTYDLERNSTILIGAFEKKYLFPKGTMTMASDYMDFLNEHTGWAKKRDFVNKQEHRRASFKFTDPQGNIIEKGYKSEIIAVTFKDNPDAARGKDANLVLMEEVGVFPNLKPTYAALEPLVRSGAYQTGQIILFGTGANMEGGTVDFEDMFNDPDTYNMIAVENKWDDNAEGTFCGFYFPDKKDLDGFMDDNGNSNEIEAEAYEDNIREAIRKSAKDKKALDRRIVEHSNKPKETFLRIKGNIFPTADLGKTLGLLEANNDQKNYWIGSLILNEDGKVEWEPNKNIAPILNYPLKKGDNPVGCVVIYEPPQEVEGRVYPNMYIAGCDPYDHDQSGTGSIGSTLIYNRLTKKIVAEYSGRPETANEYYEIVRRLLMYYNATILYENERKGLFQYFEFKNCLYLLADEPEIIRDIIKDSHVSRKKGMHMTKELGTFGEGLIKSWLIEPYDDRTPDILNLHKMRCIPLLKELIAYDGEKNTDRVSAMIMLMYYILQLRKHIVVQEKEDDGIEHSAFFNTPHFFNKKNINPAFSGFLKTINSNKS